MSRELVTVVVALSLVVGFVGSREPTGEAILQKHEDDYFVIEPSEIVSESSRLLKSRDRLPRHLVVGLLLRRGWANIRLGQYELAKTDALEIQRMSSQCAEAHGILAMSLAGVGRGQEAVAAAKVAIANDPNSAKMHVVLGVACLAANDPDGALCSSAIAIKLNPQAHEAYYVRGAAHFGKAEPEAALRDVNESIARQPVTSAVDPDQPYLLQGKCQCGIGSL